MGVGAQALIVTNELDLGADFVVREFGRRGVEVLRCNTERLPEWSVEMCPGAAWRLVDPFGRLCESETVRGVWWRRPRLPEPDGDRSSSPWASAMAEQWQAFMEALESVPGPKWLSAPSAIRRAEDKALQLAEAQKVGLRVPATLITNSLSEARSFVAARGAAVSKSVTAAFWEHGGNASFVYAQRVVAAELPDAQNAFGAAPIVLQELIEPKRDVRVTVVGERVLAAILESTSVVDWRLEPERVWRSYELPDRLERKCVALVRRLGLRFSGIDLLRDDQERLWFLEVNPNGEWGWLEKRAGLRIAEAIVEELLS